MSNPPDLIILGVAILVVLWLFSSGRAKIKPNPKNRWW